MKLRIRNSKFTLEIMGWLQFVGGLFGYGLLAYLMLNAGAISGPVLLIFCIGACLFSFSVYCGRKLLYDDDKMPGIKVSLINQFLQMFQWSILGYGFTYSSALAFTVGAGGANSMISFGASITSFSMAINSGDEFYIKFNYVVILTIAVLFDIMKEFKTGISAGAIIPDNNNPDE